MKYIGFTLVTLIFLSACKSTEKVAQVSTHSLTSNAQSSNTQTQHSNSTENATDGDITLEEFCKTNPCRKNRHVKLNTPNGQIDQVLPLYWPVAFYDRISILPGDELLIEADVLDGNRIGNFKLVTENKNPNKTIRIAFTQMDSNHGMMLSVKNPFSSTIKYHLNMVDFSSQPHQTSSCPVRARRSVYESWPHPIPELILSDMRFIDDSEEGRCIY